MEKYVVQVGWIERHVEQVRDGAACGREAAAVAGGGLRGKCGDRMVQTTGGEDFRATEVQQITRRPSAPKKMPRERRSPKGRGRGTGEGTE